jgi:cobaltochelatase CobN
MGAAWGGPRTGRAAARVLDDPWRSGGRHRRAVGGLLRGGTGGGRRPQPIRPGRQPAAVLDLDRGRPVARRVDACGGVGNRCHVLTALRRSFCATGTERRADPWDGPTCCRPGAIFIPSTPAPYRHRRPGPWVGNRRQLLVETLCPRSRRLAETTHALISAWGTSNMRTGGDDIAQALALMGVRPTMGQRVAPRHRASRSCRLDLLDRPRVDVTLQDIGVLSRCVSQA